MKSRAQRIIAGINVLIKKYPRANLSYYGIDYNQGPLWWLDGITPVGVESALRVLRERGANTERLDKLFAQQECEKMRRHAIRMSLVGSAKKKLTAAEINACNL